MDIAQLQVELEKITDDFGALMELQQKLAYPKRWMTPSQTAIADAIGTVMRERAAEAIRSALK